MTAQEIKTLETILAEVGLEHLQPESKERKEKIQKVKKDKKQILQIS
ncbi:MULTISPECIES: hypothetical protein [Desulfosporosinus]|uniref:Uncharacterized protein n=1 Tax=Desulfosporosinus acididurans TaxID=476652 RepID=A0A0J1IQ55_9FIRM|nr:MULTISPECIES: hypothetical protein [Desulfosporosinus]KLU66821.1 hypothetical protein DEAC_c14890 [Desulfosporosinus acididurans]